MAKKKMTFDERMAAQKKTSAGVDAVIRGKGDRKKFTIVDKKPASEFGAFMGKFLRSTRPQEPKPKATNLTPNTKLKLVVGKLSEEALIDELKKGEVRAGAMWPYLQREGIRRQNIIDQEGENE